MFSPGLIFYLMVEGLDLLGEEIGDDLAPRPVVVALKDGRNGGLQGVDQFIHLTLEDHAQAGREFQGQGLVRLAEIMDIAPVAGGWFPAGLVMEEGLNHAVAARTLRADDKEVESMLAHADAEIKGLQGPVLADETGKFLDFGGGFKGKGIRITTMTGLVRTDLMNGH